jgi:hypothetical protein
MEPPHGSAGLLVALLLIAAVAPALRAAELKINPPSVPQGELSIEDNSSVIVERGKSTDTAQSHFAELGYGVTDFWWTEIEGHWQSAEDGLAFSTVDFENAFRVLRQGEYWPETAVFLEYDRAVATHTADQATIAGLFTKDFGPSSTTLNVLFDHDLGPYAGTGTRLRYAGISTWEVVPVFAPGIQFFGQPGRLGDFLRLGAQDQRLGPAIAGAFDLERVGGLDYRLAYLFGLTAASPTGTVVWELEYTFRF